MKVDFIGIGAQKAATSWIAECLRQHPNVHISPEKELHFFSDDAFFTEGVDEYAKRLGVVPDSSKVIGEFSTSYLASTAAPARIYSLFSQVKIIVSLRNPIDRSLSHLEHLRSRGVLSRDVPVKEAIAQYPEIVANSMYGAALGRYVGLFPREHIHIVLFDDISSQPKTVMHDIYEFLQIDSSFVPSVVYQHFNTAEVRSSWVYKKINALFFFLKRSQFGLYVLATLRTLGLTSQRLVWILNRIYGKRVYTKADSRRYLQGLFHEDIEVLEKITGVSVTPWKH